jgi:hypothetical protein
MDAHQASDLLHQTQRLTARARVDRHWTWLPLVVFGGLSLLAAPLYHTSIGLWAPLVYWLVAGPIGYTICARYHRARRQRTGIGGVPVGPYVTTGVLLLLGLLLLTPFHLEFFAIALALLRLAWRERSRSLAVVAAVFCGLSLLASLYNTENLYHYYGAFADSIEVVVLGAFLLGAGLVLRTQGGGADDPSNR